MNANNRFKSLNNQFNFEKLNTDKISYIIYITGALPFHFNSAKTFMRELALIFTEFPEKNIIVSYINEPFMFTNINHLEQDTMYNAYSWFDFFHEFCEMFDIDTEKIIFYSGNVYSKENYENWCKEKNIKNRISLMRTDATYWPRRIIRQGMRYLENVEKNKKFCMIIGKPHLQKNYIVKWYIDNILNTDKEKEINASFLYGSTNLDYYELENKYKNRIDLLPGMIEDTNIKYFTLDKKTYLPQNYHTDKMSRFVCESLLNLVVEFHEFELFSSYKKYLIFKNQNTWWSENVLSEKIYNAIICKNPFIIIGMPGTYKILKKLGYKTFDKILFDESFDEEKDFLKRHNIVINQLNSLLDTPFERLKKKILSKEIQDITTFNYNNFMQKIKERENHFEYTT